jgi:imidazolonepropionase-like amidohydrolase
MKKRLACAVLASSLAGTVHAGMTAVRAGHLVDPERGRVETDQIILVDGEKITAVGRDVTIPTGATVIDLSDLTVLPGLVDTHTHLGLTYKDVPEHDYYYLTYVMDSTPLRAIQAASNGIQLLDSGFTVVRDLGNNALYADTAHRVAIDQGWIPGPTMINSGLIIGGLGGQFWPTPEMAKQHDIVYPEYLEADTPDEIVKAVRQNLLFGAKVIKICVDCKPWGYTVDEMKLFVREADKAGLKVAGHVQTPEGATRAIDAGIWSIEHGFALTEEHHRRMAEKGIFLASTDTPREFARSPEQYANTVAKLKSAWSHGVKITFSTDMDYWRTGDMRSRGELTIAFLSTWKDAGIPAADTLKAMTVTGYACTQVDKERGPIRPGLAADFIAVRGNPLEDIDTLRDVRFVMKDGLVFKRDGVMTPAAFFHAGPVKGWRKR